MTTWTMCCRRIQGVEGNWALLFLWREKQGRTLIHSESRVHLGATKTIVPKPGFLGLAVIAAVLLALMSVRIERIGPELVHYRNLCEPAGLDPCDKPVLKGGFPFAYLFDAPGISREGQHAFVEDRLEVGALVAGVAVYVATIIAVARAILRRPATHGIAC